MPQGQRGSFKTEMFSVAKLLFHNFNSKCSKLLEILLLQIQLLCNANIEIIYKQITERFNRLKKYGIKVT